MGGDHRGFPVGPACAGVEAKSLGMVFFRSGGDDGGPGWSGLRSVAAGRTRPVGLGQDSGGIGLGDRLDRTSDDHLLESPITPTAVTVPGASGPYE